MKHFTESPTLYTFLGFSVLPHDISEIWRSPSTPPRSINAPKSVTFLTVPSIVSPSWIFSNNSFCAASFCATINCLQSPMILLLFGLYSVITKETSLSLYTDKSFTYVSETRLAGINTLASSMTTPRPPFITWLTVAVNTVWFSKASSSFLLPLSATSLLYVNNTWPSPSFTLRTLACIVSPTDTTVVKSMPGVDEYSLRVIIPSAL